MRPPEGTRRSFIPIELNYAKGCAIGAGAGAIYDIPASCQWHPWDNGWTAGAPYENSLSGAAHPVPMFTDIEFDATGSLILGFHDRFGDQTGSANVRPRR